MKIVKRIKRIVKGENKFKKVAKEWLEYKKNSIKKSTYYNYKFIIEKYINQEFGEKNIEKIKDYNQYIQKLDINIVKMRENNGTLFTKPIKYDINRSSGLS